MINRPGRGPSRPTFSPCSCSCFSRSGCSGASGVSPVCIECQHTRDKVRDPPGRRKRQSRDVRVSQP